MFHSALYLGYIYIIQMVVLFARWSTPRIDWFTDSSYKIWEYTPLALFLPGQGCPSSFLFSSRPLVHGALRDNRWAGRCQEKQKLISGCSVCVDLLHSLMHWPKPKAVHRRCNEIFPQRTGVRDCVSPSGVQKDNGEIGQACEWAQGAFV